MQNKRNHRHHGGPNFKRQFEIGFASALGWAVVGVLAYKLFKGHLAL